MPSFPDPSLDAEARFVPVVAAVIRAEDGRILLARRPAGGPHGGLWEFPGGKVEEGESPEEALVREILEELEIEIAVGEELTSVEHVYPHVAIRLTAYECRLLRGVPRPLHCQDFSWVDPDRLLSYPMPEADLPIARFLNRSC